MREAMRCLRLALAAAIVSSIRAEPGDSSSSSSTTYTYCDTCGADASYQETIDTSGTYAKRTVVSNGCPNHYNYCTGKDTDTCGAIGTEGAGTEALVQSYTFEVPASPVIATSVDTTPECVTDSIGIALNGVPIYSGAVSDNCDILDVSDSSAEWTSFDFCGGHGRCLANDCTGDYHYHFPPSCLETQIGTLSDGHSPQLGWSLDGFPIYGSFGPGGVYMTHTAQGCTGSYCLDECSGQELEISGLDSFTYRYYFNGPLSDLVSLPTDPKPATTDYPFALKCYKGCTYTQLTAGDTRCTGGSSGVTSGYVPAALAGVTAIFESSAATAAGMQCAGTGSSTSTTSETSPSTASPPPSPSTPPPLPPPPSTPLMTVATASFSAEGSVADFDDTKITGIAQAVANASSVDVSAVQVTVAAGSVVVTTAITLQDALATSTINTLTTGIFSSTTALSNALTTAGLTGANAVTVSAITSTPTIVAPPPPSAPSGGGSDDTAAIAGGAAGGGVALLCLIGLGVYWSMQKKTTVKVTAAA